MSIRELFTPVDKWNLASDELLITKMEEFSTSLFEMANEVQNSLDRVSHSISTASVKMNNVIVRLTNAAEDQYLENRVERPPEIEDDAYFKIRRKRKDDANRALIIEESSVAYSQIDRMRHAVHTAIEQLSLKENEDLVSVPESDAISKHYSIANQAGRSSFQMRLPPQIGDSRFAANRYLGLVIENLDAIAQQDQEDALSRASLYRSASVLHSQPGYGPGEMSAIPNGNAVSSIPSIGVPPPPPPPPPAMGGGQQVYQDMSIDQQLAQIRPREQTQILGEAISREPSFMLSQAGTPMTQQLQEDIAKMETFGSPQMVGQGELAAAMSAIPMAASAISAPSEVPVSKKLTKKEQKKLEKERLKQQKKEAERQKKLDQQQKKLSTAKTTPVKAASSQGSAIPTIGKGSTIVPPPPPPPPPLADFGRDRSQTTTVKKPGKALTMADEIANRRSEPMPKKGKYPKETKPKKGKTKEKAKAEPVTSAIPIPPPLPAEDVRVTFGSVVESEQPPMQQSTQSTTLSAGRNQSALMSKQTASFSESREQIKEEQPLRPQVAVDMMAELRKKMNREENKDSDEEEESESSEEDSDDDDEDEEEETESASLRKPSEARKPSQEQTDFRKNLAAILQQQQIRGTTTQRPAAVRETPQPVDQTQQSGFRPPSMMQVEESSQQSNPVYAPPPKQEPNIPSRQSSISQENDMFSRMVSAPADNLRSSNWRDGKKQLDMFGTGGGGDFDLTPDDFTSSGGGGGGGLFSFEGAAQETKKPARPSDNLKDIFEEEEEQGDDIYGDDRDSELLKYSATGGPQVTQPKSKQVFSKNAAAEGITGPKQTKFFEETKVGKGVGKIGEDQDQAFNKTSNAFWWQDEVENQKAENQFQQEQKEEPKAQKNLFESDFDETSSIASSVLDRTKGKQKGGPKRAPSLFGDDTESVREEPAPAPKADFKKKLEANLQAQMMGAPRPPQMKKPAAAPSEPVDQNEVMMSKPAPRKKKQLEKEDRLPSLYMFDEEDAQKQRAKDQPVRASAPPPREKPKQAAAPAPAPREPPKFEDYYQEEALPKRSERLFESFTTEQQFDQRGSLASQAPAQYSKKQQVAAAVPEPSFDDPFGVGTKKSKPIKKKEKLFFDDTEDESASEIDYRPQKRAPPQQTSVFAEDQAMQARAAQSNRNLFADSVVSANTEDYGDFIAPTKPKEPEKAKKKPAKKSGLNLFGGDDDTPQAPAPKKPQTKASVAKRLENLFDDDLDDDY